MFSPNISKVEVNELPVVVYRGGISLIENATAALDAIKKLQEAELIGIDTETKPSFTRGQYHKVALIQLAVEDHCFLFRLNKFPLPAELGELLSNPHIKKVGLALRDDFAGLNKLYHFKPENVIDLQTIVKSYGILELGLQKIYAIIFKEKISKNQRLTNWESYQLTEQQQRYAAMDAWAVLRIYKELQRLKPLTARALQRLMAEVAEKNKIETTSHING